jgi:butyrate kinase
MAARSGLQAEEMHCVVARLDPDSTIAAVSGDRVIDSEELPAFAGMPSGLAEASAAEIEKRIDSGDDATLRAVEAVIARIAKCVGAMCAAAGPDAEAIVLMGELCQSSSIVQSLRKRLAHLFPVFVLKDSPVLDELAAGAWRALGGEQEAKRFAQAR